MRGCLCVDGVSCIIHKFILCVVFKCNTHLKNYRTSLVKSLSWFWSIKLRVCVCVFVSRVSLYICLAIVRTLHPSSTGTIMSGIGIGSLPSTSSVLIHGFHLFRRFEPYLAFSKRFETRAVPEPGALIQTGLTFLGFQHGRLLDGCYQGRDDGTTVFQLSSLFGNDQRDTNNHGLLFVLVTLPFYRKPYFSVEMTTLNGIQPQRSRTWSGFLIRHSQRLDPVPSIIP
mmetsp:Transcript_46683/g.56094  ORF Transcript_46683/g.56094 Transcript_46683/m.56094 type:complete len:227 (+) Transcript_46683:44-724(+)